MLPAAYTWSLTAIAIAAGLAMGWTFRRLANADEAALARRKVRASLHAFRLYADEPALIFRAQKQLLYWNARYLAAIARPAAAMLAPAALLISGLDTVYGRLPLSPGEAAIVTAQFSRAGGAGFPAPTLVGRGIAVETPCLRIPGARQFCWRIRAPGGASGSVVLLVGGAALAKAVRAGPPSGIVAERRVSSLLAWLRYPGEPLLPGRSVRWIAVSYPPVTVNVFGFGVPWLLWFTLISLLTWRAGFIPRGASAPLQSVIN